MVYHLVVHLLGQRPNPLFSEQMTAYGMKIKMNNEKKMMMITQQQKNEEKANREKKHLS